MAAIKCVPAFLRLLRLFAARLLHPNLDRQFAAKRRKRRKKRPARSAFLCGFAALRQMIDSCLLRLFAAQTSASDSGASSLPILIAAKRCKAAFAF
jgi:hypothetical protein